MKDEMRLRETPDNQHQAPKQGLLHDISQRIPLRSTPTPRVSPQKRGCGEMRGRVGGPRRGRRQRQEGGERRRPFPPLKLVSQLAF